MRKKAASVRFIGSFVDSWPASELPEVAFAGRSNVGKSSMLNTLLNNKKAARVSKTPGRTQHINLFEVGGVCGFADLPGYGFAKVPDHIQEQWQGMVEGYLADRDTLRCVFVLVDGRREPQELDGMLLFGLIEAGIPACVVVTKVDKLKTAERRKSLERIRNEFRLDKSAVIPFSSVTGEGRDAVWDVIERVCR